MRKRNLKNVNQKIKKLTEEYCRKRNKLNVELQDAMCQERWAEERKKGPPSIWDQLESWEDIRSMEIKEEKRGRSL